MKQIKDIFKSIKLDKMKLGKIKKMDKNAILLMVAVFCVLATGLLILTNFGPSDAKIAKKSVEYINSYILQGQGTATLEEVSRESGLIKIKIDISGQPFDSYATKDGKLLFPNAFNLNENPQEQAN